MATKGKNAPSRQQEIQLPPIEFKPSAPTKAEVEGILIASRQLPGFPIAAGLLAHAMTQRADIVMLDYTQQGVAIRFRVDGMPENMPPMDRESGDAALVALKRLSGMNPMERRARQEKKLGFHFAKEDWVAEIVSQGVPTGERVVIRIDTKKPRVKSIADLGIRDKLQEDLRGFLNDTGGIVVISGPPSHGLPTTWRMSLELADRFVRDFVSLEDKAKAEPDIINVTQNVYDLAAGETPDKIMQRISLKQPDVYVVPEFVNEETIKLIVHELTVEKRHCITRIGAQDAVEAYCKLLTQYRGQANNLVKLVTCVLNVRIIRKLCDKCRQPFQPAPQLLQKLGLPPDRVKVLYQPYVPPPPEQRVDAKGNPIEIPICPQCGGRGYFGRMGIYELLKVDDNFRKAAMQQPNPEALRPIARKLGHKSFQEEGLLAVVMGLTSLQEWQRVLATPIARPGA